MVLVGSFLFMNLVLGGKALCGEAIESSGFGTLLGEAGPCLGRRGLDGGGGGLKNIASPLLQRKPFLLPGYQSWAPTSLIFFKAGFHPA